MKLPALLFALVTGALLALHAVAGWSATYAVAYGAVVLMAAMIAATFLWLWAARTTPLALGMAFSWAGTASVLGWWWLFRAAGRPAAMEEHGALFACVALTLVGAGLHFHVIERSMGLRRGTFLLPVAGAVGVSALLVALT